VFSVNRLWAMPCLQRRRPGRASEPNALKIPLSPMVANHTQRKNGPPPPLEPARSRKASLMSGVEESEQVEPKMVNRRNPILINRPNSVIKPGERKRNKKKGSMCLKIRPPESRDPHLRF